MIIWMFIVVLAKVDCLQDVSGLNLAGDPDVQVEQVLKFIHLKKSDMNFTQLYNDIQETLGLVWPDFKMIPFGSLTSNLGIISSDIDHLIIIPNTKTKAVELARRAYRLFQQRPDIYGNVKLKTNKRVPLVMFLHIPSGWHSDLNFSVISSIRNSELIGYILNIDPRAADLAKIIKYWSKIHNLYGTELLSAYCHYALVIFYFQQKHILPVVKDLQKNTWVMFNDWNTGFHRVKYVTNNNESLYHLLGGYFKFYSVFNYDRFIISPFTGRMLEKKDFESLESVPDDFTLYKYNVLNNISQPYPLDGLISIQDPFDHNRNIATINEERTEKVISHFKYAAKKFEHDEDNTFLRSILTRDEHYELINRLNESILKAGQRL